MLKGKPQAETKWHPDGNSNPHEEIKKHLKGNYIGKYKWHYTFFSFLQLTD